MKNVILFVLVFVSSMAFSQSKETFTCGQTTKKGTPCKNRVTEAGARCWMHGGSTKTDYRDWETDRKSTRLNSSHSGESRMPSSA